MVAFEIGDTTIRANTSSDLFSPKGLDGGTRILLESIAKQKFTYKTALDWGCGWGAMALWLGKNIPDAQVIGLDSDVGAVSIAKENVELNALNNVNIVASHGFSEIINEQKFDLIVSNPPTHRGREVVEQMITESLDRLNIGGNLVIVVEARLKPWVARQMKQVFGDYKIAKRGPKHVVLMATKVVQ